MLTLFWLLLAHICIFLALVSAEEEFSIEKLNSNHSENEVEEQVDDQDVEHVFQRVDDTIKDSF